MSNKFERPIQETKYPAIPEPTKEVHAMLATINALKEAVELLTRQRKNTNPPVFWNDLERMGYAKPEDQIDPWKAMKQNDPFWE